EVPAKGTQTAQTISSQTHADGSVDTVSIVAGLASHHGRFTAVQFTHVLAPVYAPASNSLIFSFTFTANYTAANEPWDTKGEGTTIVPLDAGFAPLPPPWSFSGTYEEDGGSTFQGTFQGLDFGDGTVSATWAGTALSRGAGKK